MPSPRVFAISDLHVDYKENLDFVTSWPKDNHKLDALIVAGDVTDNLKLLEKTLRSLKSKFGEVFFVPGNHEVWIRPHENCRDSIAKYKKILGLCERLGVDTKPKKFQLANDEHVWVVPLHSWYAKPEEDYTDTLYMTHPQIPDDVKASEAMWMDNHLCKWPKLNGITLSKYFAGMNEVSVNKIYDGPVISFSHMLPRRELIRADADDWLEVNRERRKHGLGDAPKWTPAAGMKGFNFTRYAGCNILDEQIRKIGAKVHVYGHQHRNRDRIIDEVQYISHCLGNIKEQKDGFTWGISEWKGPKQVWPIPETDTSPSSSDTES